MYIPYILSIIIIIFAYIGLFIYGLGEFVFNLGEIYEIEQTQQTKNKRKNQHKKKK